MKALVIIAIVVIGVGVITFGINHLAQSIVNAPAWNWE